MGLFGAKNRVGVYIDAETVCVVNVGMVATKPRIIGFAEVRGPNTFETTAEKNEELAQKIRKALHDAGANVRGISLAVSGEGSLMRHFELPPLPKKEEKSAVRFEAQKYVPFDIKDIYFDYETYPDLARKKTGVVFFACKKKRIDQVSALLVLLSIKVDSVELISQAVTRAFHSGLTKDDGQVQALVVPDGTGGAEVLFFRGASVLATRHISLSPKADATAPDIPFIVSELRISLDYFYDNFKGEKVTHLHLSGAGGESSRVLEEAIRKELSLAVQSSNFLQTICGEGKTASSAVVVAYGLALGALLNIKRANLRSADSTEAVVSWEDEKKLLQDEGVKGILGAVGLLFLVYLYLANVVNSKNAAFKKAVEEYPKALSAGIQEPITDLQNKSTLLLQKSSFVGNVLDKRVSLTAKLNELVKIVPENVRLLQMRYEDSINSLGMCEPALHLEGVAVSLEGGSDLSVVNQLVQQMSANPEFMRGFDEIKISSTKRTTVDSSPALKFSLECVVTRRVGGY